MIIIKLINIGDRYDLILNVAIYNGYTMATVN